MVDRKEIARIIDANFNRAREGLRVLEEVQRFIIENPELSQRLKSIRHELVGAVTSFGFSRAELLEARDSDTDIGRKIEGERERDRANLNDIIASNFSRVEESLRAIEEFGKLLDPQTALRVKDIRYDVYTLEKEFVIPK